MGVGIACVVGGVVRSRVLFGFTFALSLGFAVGFSIFGFALVDELFAVVVFTFARLALVSAVLLDAVFALVFVAVARFCAAGVLGFAVGFSV